MAQGVSLKVLNIKINITKIAIKFNMLHTLYERLNDIMGVLFFMFS